MPSRSMMRAWGRMTYYLRKALEECEVRGGSRYDGDYVAAALMEWLEKENMVLTGTGLKRLRKP